MKLLERDQLDEKWFHPVVAPLVDLKMDRGQATAEDSHLIGLSLIHHEGTINWS